MKKSSTTPNISEAQRKEIIETASRIAIEQYHKEAERVKKAAKNKRLHNTELLMKNYRKFVIHSESAIYDASQVDDDLDLDTLLDIMDCGGKSKAPSVRSVQESVAKTRLLIRHVDTMLSCFEAVCLKSKKPEDARKLRVIQGLYLADEPKTPQEIAEEEKVDPSTVYRDKRDALRQLSALIFGYFE